MTASLSWTRLAIGAYLLIFFGYLFGPLVIMSITAFNSSSFPRIWPWECLTFAWFEQLANDQRLMQGLRNSLIIGVGVVVLSVALGLAGSLLLTQIWPRARAAYYTIITAPILMPGVVIGISTVLFWDRFASMLGLDYGSALYDGIFLTILGQSCFIASYCMLVFVARLQRFDMQLLDAALDLGATNAQAFRKILLPFLQPAIFSAAVIAFLASFENYNTSVFTISHYNTFTIEVAQKVRLGIDPSISALAVIVITLTLIAALFREAAAQHQQRSARRSGLGGTLVSLATNPAAVLTALVLFGSLGVVAFATRHDPAACKASIIEERRLRQRQFEEQQRTRTQPVTPAPTQGGQGSGAFGDIFNPGNLQQAPAPAPTPATPTPPASGGGNGAFGDIFNPGNLQRTPAPAPEPTPTPPASPSAPAGGNGAFGDIFNPGNLKPQAPSGN